MKGIVKKVYQKSSARGVPCATSLRMRQVKSTNTAPEKVLRQLLRKKGLVFRTNVSGTLGKPDIVFPERKLLVFVDGDFWHGGQWQKRGLHALEEQFENARNRDYWLAKIRRNMRRDCTVTARSMEQGCSLA